MTHHKKRNTKCTTNPKYTPEALNKKFEKLIKKYNYKYAIVDYFVERQNILRPLEELDAESNQRTIIGSTMLSANVISFVGCAVYAGCSFTPCFVTLAVIYYTASVCAFFKTLDYLNMQMYQNNSTKEVKILYSIKNGEQTFVDYVDLDTPLGEFSKVSLVRNS